MFHSARLTLTFWYLMVIMFISIVFSVAIYSIQIAEIERFEEQQRAHLERRIAQDDPMIVARRKIIALVHEELIGEVKHRIFFRLVLVNGVVFLFSGVFGYLLAGRTLKPIQDMVDEQNRFISDASHEMKTPLTSLKTAFEVYLRNNKRTKKEADEIITESVSEVDRLGNLTKALLNLASNTSAKQAQFESVPLTLVITDAIKKIQPLARKKKINIEEIIQPVFLEADRSSLLEVFIILLDNAVKYNKEGGKIIISAKTIGNSIEIAIEDTGIGIAAHEQEKIFDRFYRSDSSRSTASATGYGLGLSIAKRIVQSHKGSIQVRSRLQKGSLFTLRFPKKQKN